MGGSAGRRPSPLQGRGDAPSLSLRGVEFLSSFRRARRTGGSSASALASILVCSNASMAVLTSALWVLAFRENVGGPGGGADPSAHARVGRGRKGEGFSAGGRVLPAGGRAAGGSGGIPGGGRQGGWRGTRVAGPTLRAGDRAVAVRSRPRGVPLPRAAGASTRGVRRLRPARSESARPALPSPVAAGLPPSLVDRADRCPSSSRPPFGRAACARPCLHPYKEPSRARRIHAFGGRSEGFGGRLAGAAEWEVGGRVAGGWRESRNDSARATPSPPGLPCYSLILRLPAPAVRGARPVALSPPRRGRHRPRQAPSGPRGLHGRRTLRRPCRTAAVPSLDGDETHLTRQWTDRRSQGSQGAPSTRPTRTGSYAYRSGLIPPPGLEREHHEQRRFHSGGKPR